jgi:hypothetical protein
MEAIMKAKLLLIIILMAIMVGCTNPPKTYQISGVVEEVEYIAEGSSFNSVDILVTVVRFKDGRVKAFNGISGFTFVKGAENTIKYSSKGHILNVTS